MVRETKLNRKIHDEVWDKDELDELKEPQSRADKQMDKFIERRTKECSEEIINCVNKYFPKGDKKRGEALVLQAVSFLEGKKQGIKEFELIFKRCISGWKNTLYEWKVSIIIFALLSIFNLIVGILIGVNLK